MELRRRMLLVGVLVTAVLAAPIASAQAVTFFVKQGGGTALGCPQATPCSLAAAVSQANLSPATSDTVRVLGPLTWTQPVDLTASPIALVGSGPGAGGTLIHPPDQLGDAVRVGPASSATQLKSQATSNNAFTLTPGATISFVTAENDGTSGSSAVFVGASASGPTKIANVAATVPNGTSVSARAFGVSAGSSTVTITESSADVPQGGEGLKVETGTTVILKRSTLRAPFGVVVTEGVLDASDGVLRTTGGSATDGVHISGSSESPSTAFLIHMTIDGKGSTGTSPDGVDQNGNTSVFVQHSILRAWSGNDLFRISPSTDSLTVGTSDFATSSPAVPPGSGNLNVSPAFRDRDNGDYRLLSISRLIDTAGNGGLSSFEANKDLGGRPRIVDGNGDGFAARDMGAYEFQPGVDP